MSYDISSESITERKWAKKLHESAYNPHFHSFQCRKLDECVQDVWEPDTVLAADIDAYAGIMARYEAKLHRYVVYLIHDVATADDVVQDTFIKTYKNLHGFNPKYKFSSWIYRIAHNEAMNAVKKQRHITDDDISELPDMGYDQLTEDLIDSTILKKYVHGYLGKLDPKYREVIQLIYFEHMKYEEVSDILHIPTSTVGVRVSRAKSRLKELCEQKGVKR